MTKKRVFIIHGWAGYPEEGWLPWLKQKLERRGVEVIVPAMPNARHPQMAEWLAELAKVVGAVDEQTYFVGHSLGCITILRYLEQLGASQKAGGVVLVAGFSESLKILKIEGFFKTPLNYGKVKNSCNKIVAINSDNDPFVPLAQGETMRDKLGAELVVMPGAGHINKEAGFLKLPIGFDKVCQVAGLKRSWFSWW